MTRQRIRIVMLTHMVALLFLAAAFGIPTEVMASETVQEQFQVSEGVHYRDIRSSVSSELQAVRVMEIDTSHADTSVALGFPGLNKLMTTTSLARSYQRNGHRVVGAVNASFFHIGSRIPMYLISQNNILTFAGQEVSDSENNYVNEPIAFGMNKSGTGMIDHYQLELDYTYKGKEYEIASANKARTEDSITLYTPSFHGNTTETNEWGAEVVITTEKEPVLEFGSTYKGTISAVHAYGDTSSAEIPENGFVLSGHGESVEQFADMEIGEEISFQVDIDEKWKNSSFMLASGPMLVKDGEVNLSMNPNSWRASIQAPRTAVAVDETGEKVFFITADGRQRGYAKGMTLTELAQYAVKLGADRALNLDGGGSATMAVRNPGYDSVQVANKPSDGKQRGVSTILMAVSTASKSFYFYTDVNQGDSHTAGIEWLTGQGIIGYEDGSFGVGKELTRPHAAIMFTRVLGLKKPSKDAVSDYFDDVQADDRYAEYIAAVGEAGVFKGSNGNYLPDKMLTRQQMASTLVTAFDLESKGEAVDINLTSVAPSHKDSVQALANLGITNQLKDFRPSEAVTRGQFATFLYQSQRQ